MDVPHAQEPIEGDHCPLTEHYERLRRDHTRVAGWVSAGHGLAIMLRSGMVAWLKAWSTTGAIRVPTRSKGDVSKPPELAFGLRTELTSLLTTMTLANLTGVE